MSSTDTRTYPAGDFSFMKEGGPRWWCTAMYNAVERHKAWDAAISRPPNDYSDPVGYEAVFADPEVDACGHSGMTLYMTLLQMHRIKTVGWDAYVQEVLSGWVVDAKPATLPTPQ